MEYAPRNRAADRWRAPWLFHPPGWLARSDARLAGLDQNPAFFLLALDDNTRSRNWPIVIGSWCWVVGLILFAGLPGRPVLRVVGLLGGGIPGLALWASFFRSPRAISALSIAELWTEAMRSAPITAEELMSALWGSACRRGRMAFVGAAGGGAWVGAFLLGLSPHPVSAVLSWMGAAWGGFTLNYCLSPHPSLAGCRAIALTARARARGLGGLLRRLLHSLSLLMAVASAMAIMGWVGYHLASDGPDGTAARGWIWVVNRIAALSPLARMSISSGVGLATAFASNRFFALKAEANWRGGVEALRVYLRAETPRIAALIIR